MRMLIAPDAFKGSLTAGQAAEAMAAGMREAVPDAVIDMLPLADGGEGTLDVLYPYKSHEEESLNYREYFVYIDSDGVKSALVESARCLGLTLPSMQEKDAWQRGSGALGACIRHCLGAGIRRFVIGLGGSATNDGGLGLLAALDLQARDDRGNSVSPDLRGVMDVASVDISNMDARLAACDLTILCDVEAPLCGPGGASAAFGPQKGLRSDRVAAVDRAMARYADLTEAAFDVSARSMPGSGAAGGLGFALALLGGRLVSGADYVIEKTGLAARLVDTDWLVTGEGRSDAQTLQGKLPLKVADMAHAAGVRVALIAGDVVDMKALAGHFDAMAASRPDGMAVPQAMADAAMLLRRASARWAASLEDR